MQDLRERLLSQIERVAGKRMRSNGSDQPPLSGPGGMLV